MRGVPVIGVDFTSAPTPRKPITVAVGTLLARGRAAVYSLDAVETIGTLDAFAAFLRADVRWIGGFDLPFGQPRPLIEHEGWPTEWRRFVRFYCGQPRDRLRGVFRRWCAGRPVGDKFAWRRADRPAGSSPAMRWANPPVAWMMHAGIGRMLAAGLSFPAHDPPRRAGAGRRIALEAYPGYTARQVVAGSYKSDVPAKQTADREVRRRSIVRALVAGRAGLGVTLEVSRVWRRRLIADGSGDLLDAVICGLQAGHAAVLPGYGLPADLDRLEGWIASVPARR
ncbi:MAG: DUF429 domain-containing protein [Planctomycetia bacterium]|jgi:hypothetical protein